MKDRAAWWVRVSGDTQSEEDQVPDIRAYSEGRGYLHDRTYEVHGKSAYHGAQDPYWQRVVQDFQADEIDVVVLWMVDRLDRQNILHAVPMVSAVLDVGGRIEFSEQPEANLDASDPDLSDKLEAFVKRIQDANRESAIKSKRVRKAQRARRDKGSAVGRAPWGYEIRCTECDTHPPRKETCRKHVKIFAPTAVGRKYVPLIFRAVIDGKSLRDVAAWLDSEQVKPMRGGKWHEGYIGNRLIKNPVYHGARRNSGKLETEKLVSVQVWQQANASLASRYRPGRKTETYAKPLLQPICGACYGQVREGCPDGLSPMYRVFVGKPEHRTAYYRCHGHGPQRKGCGAPMVPVEWAEAGALVALSHMNEPHYELAFVPGDDVSERVAKLKEQAIDAYRTGDKARFAELDGEADQLDKQPRVRPHWEHRESKISEAAYFAGLDVADRPKYIAERFEVVINQAKQRVDLTERIEWGG